jgi:hypothetical protein
MSAGGLRSRADSKAKLGRQAARVGDLGTDPADGLAVAKLDDTPPNPGRTREAVLGSESFSVARA